ncbi:MAG TPA: tetratricopeptide repeat protein, partial [Thermoanaerobaculia bacterium]|nr:tetratricopeptide repeat protein [Thermoanaerobaculia bacterium]
MRNDHHPSLETLAKWLTGDLAYEDLLKLVEHFVTRCPTCSDTYQVLLRLKRDVEHWDEKVAVFEGQQALELFEQMSGLPFDEQLSRVRDDEDFQTWGFCQLLLKKSLEAAFEDPGRAVNFADLAVKVSQFLEDAYDPYWVLDLRAKASAYLGNARRVLGELRSAESAFRDAESFLAASMTGNIQVEAEVLELKATLRRSQRDFSEAVGLLDRAYALYEESGDPHRMGRTLISKAKVLEDRGDLEGAIELLPRALDLVDIEKDPRLAVYGRHNLVLSLTTAGRHEEAAGRLPEVRDLLSRIAKPLDLVRLRWTEGRIAAGLGNRDLAEAAFREVQHEFFDRHMAYDAALVSLDLGILYAS